MPIDSYPEYVVPIVSVGAQTAPKSLGNSLDEVEVEWLSRLRGERAVGTGFWRLVEGAVGAGGIGEWLLGSSSPQPCFEWLRARGKRTNTQHHETCLCHIM